MKRKIKQVIRRHGMASKNLIYHELRVSEQISYGIFENKINSMILNGKLEPVDDKGFTKFQLI